MKILHLIPAYLPASHYGGPLLSVHYLNKWLVKKGAEVTVYTTNVNGSENLDVPLGKTVDMDGVRIFYFPVCFPRFWFYSKEMYRKLAVTIKEFDLIHITSVFLSASTLGAYYAREFHKPYIISPRGSLMKEPLKGKSVFKKFLYLRLFERRNLRDASAIHFAVPQEEEEYKNFRLPLKKSLIIPNGLDTEVFKKEVPLGLFREKFGISQEKSIILFLGRLSRLKGLDTLLPAFAELVKKEPRVILVLAGEGNKQYCKSLKSQISNLKIDDCVIFTGMLLGDDKIAALQESDIFVLPSYSESFGMAVVEAMYFGLPVIVTKAVGISPNIEIADAGLVIKKNPEELAEAILRLLNNPSLAKEMGKRGKQLVETEFSCERAAKEFIKAYNELIISYDFGNHGI